MKLKQLGPSTQIFTIAFTVAYWLASFRTADANHGEPRPLIPDFPNAAYSNSSVTAENFVICCSSISNIVLGWAFNGFDPDHTWSDGSPTYDLTNYRIDGSINFHLFNGSTLRLDRANKVVDPTGSIGPNISSYDASTVEVTDSFIDSVFALGESEVTIKSTGITGSITMGSDSTMTLDSIAPKVVPGFGSEGNVTAVSGMTTIVDSTINNLAAINTATVTVSGSTVGGVVTEGESGSPRISLDGTTSGSLNASIGSINMSAGKVMGGVSASGTGTIGVDGGQITGSASAGGSATVNFLGTKVNGNLNAGDTSDSTSTINQFGGSVGGVVQAVGHGVVNLANVVDIGDGAGFALQSHDNGAVNVQGTTAAINGGVTADGNSTMLLPSNIAIFGDALVGGKVSLSLIDTNVTGSVQTFEEGAIQMTGGTTTSVFSSGNSKINLTIVLVTESIDATGESHLTFDAGSQALRDVTANGESFVTVKGGTINGNLTGFNESFTVMSGGHVAGFPIFIQQAKFLFTGGSFGLMLPGVPTPFGAGSQQALAGGAGGAGRDPFDSPLPGFVALDQAEIQFSGFGLQSTLIDPNFEGKYSIYQLAGRLADGSSINGGLVYVQNQTGAGFQLIEAPVPEPSSLALLLVAFCVSGSRFVRSRMLFSDRGAPR